MCGICGYVSVNRIDDRVLEQMRDTMIHRGPNDAGIWQIKTSSGYVGLAHRRLSIFDLSELGHQPMLSTDGTISVVFNGEIYNFKEIRSELQHDGYFFRSECDTEVIIYAYDKWKEECFSRFNGMFSIAIWDRNEEKLVMARDRMGVKPFYYFWNRTGRDFVFASELKPIMKYPGFKKDIDTEMLGKYLCNKYIVSPNSIFCNTYKLEPGTYAVYKNNELTIKRYWNILDRKKEASSSLITDFDTAKKELERILTDAVNKRMVADVPVGTFLSSGVDSALITAIAQKNSATPIRTFTIGFNDKERNEAVEAKKIAACLGTDHTELYIGEQEIFDLIKDIPVYYDEPFADASQLPTMLVSKLAADNVTVALSGDGGDELFCGYNMYDLVYIAQKTDWIGNIAYHIPGMGTLKEKMMPELRAFINNRGDYRSQLFADVTSEQVERLFGGKRINSKHVFEENLKYRSWQERRMLLDMCSYLPDDIMAKTDRASMKYSLEVRSPLLDYRVVEQSFEIPHNFKYLRFDKKHILKALAYDYIPQEMLSKAKRGFGVPLAKWLRGPLKSEISRFSEDTFLKKQGLFDVNGVRHLIEHQECNNKIIYSSVLWSFYVFQRWWDEYIA